MKETHVSNSPLLFIGVTGMIFFLWWRSLNCSETFTFDASDKQVLHQIRHRLEQVHEKAQTIDLSVDKKSYTINKQKIYLCLKDKHGKYYDMNMMMYVALHELAHCLCDDIGHTAKFHDIFETLLDKAHTMKLYDKTISPIADYCIYDNEEEDKIVDFPRTFLHQN